MMNHSHYLDQVIEIYRAQVRAELDDYYARLYSLTSTSCATFSTPNKSTARISLGRLSVC